MSRAVALLAPALCSACLMGGSPNSARTLAPGQLHQRMGFTFDLQQSDTDAFNAALPMPSYELRLGVVERLDVGLHLALPAASRADLKLQLVDTAPFALALDPMAWISLYPTNNGRLRGTWLGALELPLVAEVRLLDSLALVTWAGPGLGAVLGTGQRAAFVHGGLAVRIDAGGGDVLAPEVSVLFDPVRGEVTQVGLAFHVEVADRPR